ncbi:BQ5605_C016g08076 [Microbotryum silenes-dioicae]|uniref:BQ5605_C016g08076 protein n=1 Tax=Microbotryum silenes-dioicae TaxID=796604 RepID=A0A2X0NSV8_9BASI|nr:BQ5605_C016g08076 [Microbotryum silenes-dioicae]
MSRRYLQTLQLMALRLGSRIGPPTHPSSFDPIGRVYGPRPFGVLFIGKIIIAHSTQDARALHNVQWKISFSKTSGNPLN